MASATFVDPNIRVVCRGTTTFMPTKQLVHKSTGSDASLSREKNLKISGLENFRESLTAENISERTSEVITNTEQPRPTSNYESSWHKYVGSRIELKIDPHTCHVNFVLDFLVHLFGQKLDLSNSQFSQVSNIYVS